MSDSPERRALEELASKVDVGKPLCVTHYFYFPEEQAASAACSLFKSRGHKCKYLRSPDGVQWSVYVILEEVVSSDRLAELQNGFSRIAAGFGGEYDGWDIETQ